MINAESTGYARGVAPDGEFSIAPEILEHYSGGAEAGRLESGSGALELARMQELLRRYLPSAPARLLDIGGGPGVYAGWLAELGYDVHLVDPVPVHVEQATARSSGRFSAAVGDARSLDHADGSIDAVLLLGPLYHLTERGDRLRALMEARRVLRPGGTVAVAAISRFVALFDGLTHGYFTDPRFWPIVERDLADGQHRSPDPSGEYFTTAYFHHPDELETELRDAGLEPGPVLGIEGPGWLRPELWNDAALRPHIVNAARAVESEPTLLGLSAHLFVVGRRPGGDDAGSTIEA